jgi:membrane dipeptidase
MASGLRAMICDVSQVEEVRDADGHPRYLRTFAANDAALDAAVKRIAANDSLYVATRGSDIGNQPGCATFLQFQSCEMIEHDLSRISYFYQKGLRVLQLTHHNNNAFAGGAIEVAQSGLTALGREGIREMNRLHMLTDVAHGSSATIIQAAEYSHRPIVYSHGACRAIVDHPRCIDDEGIRNIASRGGVIGIFMMSFWLTRDANPRVDHFIMHLKHVIKKGGLEAVAIANDFPMAGQENLRKLGNDNKEGVKEYLAWWSAMRDRGVKGFEFTPEHVVIPELNNINRMSLIAEALTRSGFKGREIDLIMGKNWVRVLTDVCL